ncbi:MULTISPECIES: heparin lyase I family protein [unclassified Rhizobium]|uniref:heparin lyase I family protein n=1 Tax=unclassified Rhizobium TaxID=2613769 RepID=UPI001679F99F|nr:MULTISPECIES: heparin lyase I family protein [unclassified Rhizobium]
MFWTPLLFAALVGCGHTEAGGSTNTIKEDFASAPSTTRWYVCHRPENSFHFGKDHSGRTAMVATVRPEPEALALLKEHHDNCLDESYEYKRDGKERAELWENRDTWLPLGTDVWYRFDMFVDKRLKPTAKRLVIGQWKEQGGARSGPLVAQRFTGRRFTISVEQDNLAPMDKPDNVLCRVLVADQLPLSLSPAGWQHDDNAEIVPPVNHRVAPMVLSIQPVTAKDPGCARGIVAEQYHTLPDPFGQWRTMVFHLRLKPDDALLEIWADGVKIGRTTGRIGYANKGSRENQYFKFGPYRDPENFETVIKLANYIRSTSRSEVDPTGKLAPD